MMLGDCEAYLAGEQIRTGRSSSRQPGHAPQPPQGRRVRERVAMDQEEIGRTSFEDAPGRCFSQQLSAADRRGRERLPRLEAGFDERLDLPGEMVRPQGSAAEIRAGCDPHARAVGEVYALDRPLAPTPDSLLPLVADEPGQRRRLREGGPGTEDLQGAHEERLLTGHLR